MTRILVLKVHIDDKTGVPVLTVTHKETVGDEGATDTHTRQTADSWGSDVSLREAAAAEIKKYFALVAGDNKTPIEKAAEA